MRYPLTAGWLAGCLKQLREQKMRLGPLAVAGTTRAAFTTAGFPARLASEVDCSNRL